MTESAALPVQPFRTTLYEPDELLGGFDPDDATSWATTHDFAVYRSWVASGGPDGPHIQAIAQAVHDSSIADAMAEFATGRRLVGIMGGHRQPRSSDPDSPYVAVTRLARGLSGAGLTCVSGGGPGAMEATHLGARTATRPWAEVIDLLTRLAEVPAFPPGIDRVVVADGSVHGAVDTRLLRRLHSWQVPAFDVADATRDGAGVSLGVPTWHYGHEPPTPLATHHAKHFHNAVREDGLLAVATAGVVFVAGAAGTVQEVFQDACQNYYGLHGVVSPMVFVGVQQWTQRLPVWPVLEALFDDHTMLHLTDDVDDAVEFVVANPPVPVSTGG